MNSASSSHPSRCRHHEPGTEGWMVCKQRGFAMTLKDAETYCNSICPSKDVA